MRRGAHICKATFSPSFLFFLPICSKIVTILTLTSVHNVGRHNRGMNEQADEHTYFTILGDLLKRKFQGRKWGKRKALCLNRGDVWLSLPWNILHQRARKSPNTVEDLYSTLAELLRRVFVVGGSNPAF